MELAHVYMKPEEKLWYVIKHFHGSHHQTSARNNNNRNGLRLEKNDIVKFGRVRLRVRDIDYAEKDQPPQQLNLSALAAGQAKNNVNNNRRATADFELNG